MDYSIIIDYGKLIYFKGYTTNKLTIYPKLFTYDTTALYYQVQLSLLSTTTLGPNRGYASITFLLNQYPTSGTCSLSETSGIALTTQFQVNCSEWIDPDGTVSYYEFSGKRIKLNLTL